MLANTCPHCGKDRGAAKDCPHCRRQSRIPDTQETRKFSTCLTIFIAIACFLTLQIFILFPGWLCARQQGQFTACQLRLKNISIALERYATNHQGHYPGKLEELVTAGYINEIPCCFDPWGNKRDTYSATYQSSTHPDAYSYYCRSSHHIDVAGSADYPKFNSHRGLIPRP